MNDFVCQVLTNSHSKESVKSSLLTHTPPTFPFISPNDFSLTHISFVKNLSAVQEPRCYAKAKNDVAWVEDMKTELAALEKNNT